jgi:DNA polymerase III delta subunit
MKTESVSPASPPHAALFTGDDMVGREKARTELVSSIFREHPDAVEEHYDSSTEPFDRFVSRIMTPSMFGSARIFHVRHADSLSGQDSRQLETVLQYDIPDAYVLVEFDEAPAGRPRKAKPGKKSGSGKAAIAATEKCAVFDFRKPPEYKIPEWLCEQAPRLFNRKISKNDAGYLVECAGTDLSVLYSELMKLDIHLPQKAPVDRISINTIVAQARSRTAYDLASALGGRDIPRALDILDSLFASAVYPPVIISAIFRHFWALLRIRAWAAANRETAAKFVKKTLGREEQSAVALEIGIVSGLMKKGDYPARAYPVIILSGVVDQARSFSDYWLGRIIRLLRDFDVDSKTGRTEADKKDLQMLCYRIARAGKVDDGGLE